MAAKHPNPTRSSIMRTPTLSQEDYASLGEQFFDFYLSRGFGKLSKREIDVLVFHLYEQLGDHVDAHDGVLAQALRTTPTRIRGLRRESRYIHWTDEEREAVVRRVLFRELAMESIAQIDADTIEITIADAMARDLIIAALESSGRHWDTSFNRSLLKLSPLAFLELLAAFLTPEQREVLRNDKHTQSLFKTPGLVDMVKGELSAAAREMAEEELSNAAEHLLKWAGKAGKMAVLAAML